MDVVLICGIATAGFVDLSASICLASDEPARPCDVDALNRARLL